MAQEPQGITKKPLKESELVNLWLWKFHRDSLQWTRKRLGILPNKEGARMFMVILRWVDAVYIKDGQVFLVEAKLVPNAGAVGQLLQYKDLFGQTPEFSAFKEYPIRLILLTTFVALDIVDLASKHDIQYEIFSIKDAEEVKASLRDPLRKQSSSPSNPE